jgi:hypothetical protein
VPGLQSGALANGGGVGGGQAVASSRRKGLATGTGATLINGQGLESVGGLHVSDKAGEGRTLCCVGKALLGLQNMGCLAFMRELFCACTGWLADGFGPLPRYDLMPQMGKSFQSPIATV